MIKDKISDKIWYVNYKVSNRTLFLLMFCFICSCNVKSFFLGTLMLNIFLQHDHAQHGATLSLRLVRSLMVWGPQSKK